MNFSCRLRGNKLKIMASRMRKHFPLANAISSKERAVRSCRINETTLRYRIIAVCRQLKYLMQLLTEKTTRYANELNEPHEKGRTVER